MANSMISNTSIYVSSSFLTCIDKFTCTNKSSAGKTYKSQIWQLLQQAVSKGTWMPPEPKRSGPPL